MKVLAGGELRHGAPYLDFVADPTTGRDVVGGAVRYATMNPSIATAVIGMAGTDELARNVIAVEGVDDTCLSQFVKWTREVAEMDRGACTRCGACIAVCPEHIEIPKVMRIYDQMRFFGMEGTARYKYATMNVNASACVKCHRCREVCPEDFDIEAVLDAAHEALAQQTHVFTGGG
jgi:hypothetical protein